VEAQVSFGQPPATRPEWFVSYAWGDATPEGRAREEVVDGLCAEAERRGIRVLRDKTMLGLGDRISRFMRRISVGDRVFVVLSDKCLKSPFCMFELHEVWRTSRAEGEAFLRRVRVYSLPDAKVWTPLDRAHYAAFWQKQHRDLEAFVKIHGAAVLGEQDFARFKMMGRFHHDVSEILATLADIVQPRTLEELKAYGFDGPPPTAPS
jgi:internalin A